MVVVEEEEGREVVVGVVAAVTAKALVAEAI